jgi:hypothetical protein
MGLLWALLGAFLNSQTDPEPKRATTAISPARPTTSASSSRSDDDDWGDYSSGHGDYFQDCADEWGMSREEAQNQINGN